MAHSLLSILIVTFNRRADVERCIESILVDLRGIEAEILVLDNGSTDGTPEMIASRYPLVRMTRWSANRGLAPALRHIVDESKGDWLLFLDSDTVLKCGCIAKLIEFAESRPRLGAVAPRPLDIDGRIQMTARAFPGPANALFGRQTLLSRIWPGNPLTRRFLKSTEQEANAPFACDWVAFAAVLVRRRALVEAGSIDPRFFVYWVDADFFKRLKGAHWEVWCCPAAEIIHAEQNRPNRVRSPIAIKDFHRGALRYFYKHHGWHGLNPLLWIAAAGLWLRARLQLAINRRRGSVDE